jgi:hypothetical protein
MIDIELTYATIAEIRRSPDLWMSWRLVARRNFNSWGLDLDWIEFFAFRERLSAARAARWRLHDWKKVHMPLVLELYQEFKAIQLCAWLTQRDNTLDSSL